jgi:hypothetical protein
MKCNVKIIHFSGIYLKYKGIPTTVMTKIWYFICAPATDFIKFKLLVNLVNFTNIIWKRPRAIGSGRLLRKASRTNSYCQVQMTKVQFFKNRNSFEGKFKYILHKYSTELLNIRIDIPTNEYRKFSTCKLYNMV